MAEKKKKPKKKPDGRGRRPCDPNQLARWIVEQSTSEIPIALHYSGYNFIRPHKSLGTTPAVAAGIVSRPWTIEILVART